MDAANSTLTPAGLPPARRADAGSVRLGGRDVAGLILVGDMYGAPYDLLAGFLDVQPARLRGIVARWRRPGYAATGRLGPGPAWCWLTRSGLAVTGQRYAPARLACQGGGTGGAGAAGGAAAAAGQAVRERRAARLQGSGGPGGVVAGWAARRGAVVGASSAVVGAGAAAGGDHRGDPRAGVAGPH